MKRIAQIDGLRALAILFVMGFHFIYDTFRLVPNKLMKFIAEIFSFGWSGVDLFFVISGFLIGSILIANKHKKNFFKTFYVRRFFRIIPVYYLLLFVFFVLSILNINGFDAKGINSPIPLWSYFTLTQNFFMALQNTLGTSMLSITWSIGIEEQFYLIIPFIIYFLNLKYLPYFLATCIVLANVFRYVYTSPDHWVPSYVLLHCRMDTIAFGVLIAYIHHKQGLENFIKKHYKKVIAIFIAAILYCVLMYAMFKDLGLFRNTVLGIIYAALVIIALGKPISVFGKFLSNKFLNWVGKISYSLYLFHLAIFSCFKLMAIHIWHATATFTTVTTLAIASILVSFGFCWLVYKYIETPLVSIGKRYNYI